MHAVNSPSETKKLTFHSTHSPSALLICLLFFVENPSRRIHAVSRSSPHSISSGPTPSSSSPFHWHCSYPGHHESRISTLPSHWNQWPVFRLHLPGPPSNIQYREWLSPTLGTYTCVFLLHHQLGIICLALSSYLMPWEIHVQNLLRGWGNSWVSKVFALQSYRPWLWQAWCYI